MTAFTLIRLQVLVNDKLINVKDLTENEQHYDRDRQTNGKLTA